ncbi:MAG: hypothetical protein HYY40_03255 [Bacteroidetes bacterium]|nr:hypothetical protein [Bacteroidota bacterium]
MFLLSSRGFPYHSFFLHFLRLCLVIILPGCGNNGNSNKSSKPLARVYNKLLLPEQIPPHLNFGTTPDDSSAVLSDFIDEWVQNTLIIRYAETVLADSLRMDDIERRYSEYRSALILHAFRHAVLSKELDTNITGQDITAFISENRFDTLAGDSTRLYRIRTVIINERKKQVVARAIEKLQEEALKRNAIQIF